jgi:hypothetical protein
MIQVNGGLQPDKGEWRSRVGRWRSPHRGDFTMRLWHLGLLILVLGIVFTIVRDPVGRIGLIVFATAMGLVVIGVTAVMALFQTIGAIGMARGLLEHGQAFVATTVVLFVANTIMSTWLFIGAWLVQAVLP